MTSRDFCYWLQGFIEVTAAAAVEAAPISLTPAQVVCIQRHLSLVFKHEIDPSMGDAEAQKQLDEMHKSVKELQKRPNPGGLVRC